MIWQQLVLRAAWALGWEKTLPSSPPLKTIAGEVAGVPFSQESPQGGRGRAQACSSHHSGDVTCSLLTCQGLEYEQAPTAAAAVPSSCCAVLLNELQHNLPCPW